jgi:hypothetical protein
VFLSTWYVSLFIKQKCGNKLLCILFYRCTFTTNEHCLDWFRRLHKATMAPSNIEDLFAFAFMAWSSEEGGEEVSARLGGSRDVLTGISSFHAEVERLRFDVHGAWRISQVSVLSLAAEFRLPSITIASLMCIVFVAL